MGKKLYVGNLPYSVRDGDLEQAFGQFGSVNAIQVAPKALALWKWALTKKLNLPSTA